MNIASKCTIDAEQSYIFVPLTNRDTGAAFAVEVCVHHRGDEFVHSYWSPNWREAVRNAGSDPYSALGERRLSLASRWEFRRRRLAMKHDDADEVSRVRRRQSPARALALFEARFLGYAPTETDIQLATLDVELARSRAVFAREAEAA